LLIEVSTGASVSGVVTIEGDRTELQFIDVHASRFEGNAMSHVRLTGPDKFTLIAVPTGEFQLSAFAVPQDKFYVKSIEAKGMDLLRTNPIIAEGDEIKDVRIVVSSDIAVVSGRVISGQDNKPLKGFNVMLRRVSGDKLRLFGGKLATTTDRTETIC
jgi:hypothetical protein